MKTVIAGFFLLLMGIQDAGAQPCLDKVNLSNQESIYKLCNNVDDIICQDVNPKERRRCDGKDEKISALFSNIPHFILTCIGSSALTVSDFIFEFVPELMRALWEATKTTVALASDALISSGPKEKSWSSKIKGMYESARSISADVFHSFSSNPKDFLANLWDKLEEAIAPAVDSYMCLKPELKVARLCSFVTAYALPPYLFAKALTKGIALVKKYKQNSLAIEKAVLQKRILQAQNRRKLTVKEYHQTLNNYRSLGYSEEEFEFLYKTGALEKIKIEKLKDVNTAAGKSQKQSLLKEFDEYQKDHLIVNEKISDATIIRSKQMEKEILQKEIVRNQKVYDTQLKLITDLQKAASQFIKQSGTQKSAQTPKFYLELNLIRTSELEMQRDLLKTVRKLKKQDAIIEIEKRIELLEKVIDNKI